MSLFRVNEQQARSFMARALRRYAYEWIGGDGPAPDDPDHPYEDFAMDWRWSARDRVNIEDAGQIEVAFHQAVEAGAIDMPDGFDLILDTSDDSDGGMYAFRLGQRDLTRKGVALTQAYWMELKKIGRADVKGWRAFHSVLTEGAEAVQRMFDGFIELYGEFTVTAADPAAWQVRTGFA